MLTRFTINKNYRQHETAKGSAGGIAWGAPVARSNHHRSFRSYPNDEYSEDDEEVYFEYYGGEQVIYIVQRVFWATQQSDQQNSIIQSLCSVNKKICDIIVDNGSCEKILARILVEHLNLSMEGHSSPYTISWIQRRSLIKVTEVCHVPFSIGKSYSGVKFFVMLLTWMQHTFYWGDHGDLTLTLLIDEESIHTSSHGTSIKSSCCPR